MLVSGRVLSLKLLPPEFRLLQLPTAFFVLGEGGHFLRLEDPQDPHLFAGKKGWKEEKHTPLKQGPFCSFFSFFYFPPLPTCFFLVFRKTGPARDLHDPKKANRGCCRLRPCCFHRFSTRSSSRFCQWGVLFWGLGVDGRKGPWDGKAEICAIWNIMCEC